MDEPNVYEDSAGPDADAPIVRDPYARELGDEWQREQPGIYRYLGPARSGLESGLDGGAFELHAKQKPAIGIDANA